MTSSRSKITSFDVKVNEQAKSDPFDMFGESSAQTKTQTKQGNDDFLDLI